MPSPTRSSPAEPVRVADHPIDVLPPAVHASAVDLAALLDAGTDKPEVWWTPGPGDIARTLGWWWVPVILGGTLVIAAVVVTFMAGVIGIGVWAAEVKLIALLVGAGLSLAGFKMKRLVHARNDLFCIHCGYSLDALPDPGVCPECGRGYTGGIIREYRKDPEFFKQRYRALRGGKHTRHGQFESGPVTAGPSGDGT